MYKQGIGKFKYYVGIDSLAKIATREDRVCVLNILGGESSQVTPVSHAFSGGNVVFGTSPGRGGQVLRTPIGDVPVFNAVREGLDAGLQFDTGVIYLPPAGVRDGVAELARVNPELAKIIVVTEKVSVHDAREIRAIGQGYGIDIFGANGLGVADSWNRVRIGGALGGDHPEESLKPGSVAIFSNSGIFHDFYRILVQALYDEGVSPYVFCVNVDAVIAALLLALLWKDYKSGSLSERDLEIAAFTVFLYGRMIGCAAKIDDHLNRGRNMDTRTPASQCTFVT